MAKKKQRTDLGDPTPATHGDLNVWGGKLQEDIQDVREDVKEVETELKREVASLKSQLNRVEGKLDKLFDHIDKRIDGYVENRASDLLKVKHDEVHLMKQQVKDHEERITVLER